MNWKFWKRKKKNTIDESIIVLPLRYGLPVQNLEKCKHSYSVKSRRDSDKDDSFDVVTPLIISEMILDSSSSFDSSTSIDSSPSIDFGGGDFGGGGGGSDW